MNTHRFSIVLCSLLIFEEVAVLNASPLVGEKVERAGNAEFSFTVSIQYKGYQNPVDGHFCTGTLITSRHVLTASHCINNPNIRDFKREVQVSVGSVDLRAGRKYNINSSITYDQWYMRRSNRLAEGDNDIAVLTLSEDVNDPSILTASLSGIKGSVLVDEEVTAAGWGEVDDGNGNFDTPRYLQKATLRVISRVKCIRDAERSTGNVYILDDHKYCTTASPRAFLTCGDSGGPLIYNRNAIVGVNLGLCPPEGENRARANNVHVSVERFLDFIGDVTQRGWCSS